MSENGSYRQAPEGYADLVVIQQACPVCGAPAGYLCNGQHGMIIHAGRSQAWRDARQAAK